MRQIGQIDLFETGEFVLIEDQIVKPKDKRKVILWLNFWTLILFFVGSALIFVVIPGGININLSSANQVISFIVWLFVALVSFLVYVIVHEYLHGLAFRLFNGNTKKQVKFGINWQSAMAYCISTIPVNVKAARLSLMMPVYVVCIPVLVIGLVTQNIWLGLLAIYYFSGSAGDIYYMWKLRKTNKEKYMHERMPTKTGYEVGYLLYEKKSD
jgi:hypothetical protein